MSKIALLCGRDLMSWLFAADPASTSHMTSSVSCALRQQSSIPFSPKGATQPASSHRMRGVRALSV